MLGIACDFCDEFAGGAENAFARRYGDEVPCRTLFAARNYNILPTLGQLVEGYVLIVPTQHFTALADIPYELANELAELTDRVRAAISDTYGPCVFFEHGARTVHAGGCGIYHAHLHAVPLSDATDPIAMLKEVFPFRELESIGEMARGATGVNSYLYYEDLHSNRYIFEADYLPSQYMRRLLVKTMSQGEWDWRKYGREEALLSTIARLSGVLGGSAGSPKV